jgi:hypothetical protein
MFGVMSPTQHMEPSMRTRASRGDAFEELALILKDTHVQTDQGSRDNESEQYPKRATCSVNSQNWC